MIKDTLALLYDHDDFMETIKTVADMGAGDGTDALWWATQTTRDDEEPISLNIKVYAVDRVYEKIDRKTHKNITWVTEDFKNTGIKKKVDLIWCHDAFQYASDPLGTLAHWHSIMNTDAMLCLTVPYNHSLREFRHESRIDTITYPGAYFNYTLSNLILLLASSGFDCRGGHFKFIVNSGWMHAAVYKGDAKPQAYMDWYGLLGQKLLPPSAEQAIMKNGCLRDSDLVLEWIDHNIYSLSLQ